ncbi:MAG: hypothetical protein QG551_410 [Patescibacteria group bacterium]|jgi:hypothetical protein|nr:hypothetical protein [Patescibacteria group bacterium]
MRENELSHTKFFTEWLNTVKGLDFIISQEKISENSDVDAIVMSSSLDKKIFIQHTSYKGDGLIYPKNVTTKATFNGKEIDPSIFPFKLVFSPPQNNKAESLIRYIKKKENKYSEEQKQKLILIIDVTIPSIYPDELREIFSENFNSSFLGVYIVQLPIPISSMNKWELNGFVYTVKDFNF